MTIITENVSGSLLGLVLADALGARFEGLPSEQLRGSYPSKEAALAYSMGRESLRYTDDGQMALILAEYLANNETIEPNELMHSFVDGYESWRGYGRGARVLIEAFRDNADYEFMAEHLFPGGSLGNGAAMRSAPIGLRFAGDADRIWEEAKRSAWPTHRHELGIEGAQLIALATSYALTNKSIVPSELAESLLSRCTTTVFQNRLERLAMMQDEEEIESFGNGIEAHESVVTALACFALHPKDYCAAVSTAIWQGGDTDTIAAMTGALVGAHGGFPLTNQLPLDRLETGKPFVDTVRTLSERIRSRLHVL
jgi:poly(ADP-ribose) glycohydrolase ARH3